MDDIVQFVGPKHSLQLLGVKLIGINAESGTKLLFSGALVLALLGLSKLLQAGARLVTGRSERLAFWTRQGIHLFTAITLLIGMVSIWFDEPARLTTALGLVTAGLAFALQRVVTAIAGYGLILRGRTFNVGDRIVMGGVRGDVIALGFLQTTIMEMGQPPSVQSADPAMWVKARQYTGRIVSVSNAQVFDEPVFNYTRDFPYVWEELSIQVAYRDDRGAAEKVLLNAAEKHSLPISRLGESALAELERRYVMRRADIKPRVYWRMTDNWLEMTVRFLAEDHGVRELKDAMSRDILAGLDTVGIGIASATFEITGLPEVSLRRAAR